MFIFDTIRFQEEFQIPEELQEAMMLLNSLYANNFEEQKSARIVSWIPVEQNQSAHYLADYGLANVNLFGEVPRTLGNLQHFLDRDMGIAVPFDVMDNLGMGEVVDADPPPKPVHISSPHVDSAFPTLEHNTLLDLFHAFISQEGFKSKAQSMGSFVFPKHGSTLAVPTDTSSLKGKGKMYEKASFNGNGVLSSAAVEVLESGSLNHISEVFAQSSVNLDVQVFQDVSAKEILDQAVQGWSSRGNGASSSRVPGSARANSDMMEVADVMAEWDSFVAPNAEEQEDI
ncbi:hypothetical protein DCAR_0100576 [Daucus carota subsp. sativus]|uniref:Uncharacterized protein n=1 Tax=Daucus carota subsp. sativus TaxID=79200 RepID=A0A166FRU9_DAUCS|nr:hypothetical protein DCAR_0100576 [Daucus carota subsp. sativus]